MLSVAICDDEQLQREYAEKLVLKELRVYNAETELFSSGEDMLRAMSLGDWTPDIAVLDIELPGLGGIELAQQINRLAPRCQIIFLTGYLQFAPEVYSVEHIYFVVKSQAKERLGAALAKAVKRLGAYGLAAPELVLKIRGKLFVVPVSKILYIELSGRKTSVVTDDGVYFVTQHPRSLLSGENCGCFFSCHQSFWVNLQRVAAVEREEFTMDNGEAVPISRANRQAAREAFFAMLHSQLTPSSP